MKEQLINLENAKLAKEKGFEQHKGNYFYTEKFGLCYLGYGGEYLNIEKHPKTNDLEVLYDVNGEFEHGDWYNAPTQSLLQKWLRENHRIIITILLDRTTNPKYGIEIFKYIEGYSYKHIISEDTCFLFRTYEGALEVALFEALKFI